MTQITLIGAGSVEFTRILLADLAEYEELRDCTIVLHDIDAERLETAERIGRYINRKSGAHFQIRSHLDRRTALDGADFVVIDSPGKADSASIIAASFSDLVLVPMETRMSNFETIPGVNGLLKATESKTSRSRLKRHSRPI